jgi:hypothetical protein
MPPKIAVQLNEGLVFMIVAVSSMKYKLLCDDGVGSTKIVLVIFIKGKNTASNRPDKR